MATPPVVEPCTACDEAKYEVQYFTVPRCFDYFDYRRWGEVFWFTYYLDNMRYSIDYHWSVMSHLPPLTMNNGNKVIFEGLWSRHTHPKDFPRSSSLMSICLKFLLLPFWFLISNYFLRDEWQTQFSHMIGASHSIDYDLWKWVEVEDIFETVQSTLWLSTLSIFLGFVDFLLDLDENLKVRWDCQPRLGAARRERGNQEVGDWHEEKQRQHPQRHQG